MKMTMLIANVRQVMIPIKYWYGPEPESIIQTAPGGDGATCCVCVNTTK